LKILQIISKVRLRQTSKKNQVQLVDKYDVFLHKKHSRIQFWIFTRVNIYATKKYYSKFAS